MTGYTVHTGSTTKFTQGWDQIFKQGAAPSSEEGKSKSPAKSAKKAASRSMKAKAQGGAAKKPSPAKKTAKKKK